MKTNLRDSVFVQPRLFFKNSTKLKSMLKVLYAYLFNARESVRDLEGAASN